MIQLKEIKKYIKKDFVKLIKNVEAVIPLDDDVLQVIEDMYGKVLNPIFGRREAL